MWRDWGNVPINSTAGVATNPSTSDLIAEVDSTQLIGVGQQGQSAIVTWILGGSTNALWQCEHASSTGLGSTAVRDTFLAHTPANQSGQYVLAYKLERGDRLRARLNAAIIGTATAKISVEFAS